QRFRSGEIAREMFKDQRPRNDPCGSCSSAGAAAGAVRTRNQSFPTSAATSRGELRRKGALGADTIELRRRVGIHKQAACKPYAAEHACGLVKPRRQRIQVKARLHVIKPGGFA